MRRTNIRATGVTLVYDDDGHCLGQVNRTIGRGQRGGARVEWEAITSSGDRSVHRRKSDAVTALASVPQPA